VESQERIGDVNPYESPRVVDEVVTTSTIGTIGIDLSTENPFLTIWTRPRATIRGIVNTDPRRYVVPLAMAGGIVHTLERAFGRNTGDTLPLATILLFVVLLGPLSGLIGLHLLGWILGVTGRWIGGRATWEEVRAAVGWSNVPVLAAGPILIVELGAFGRDLFTRDTPALASNPTFGLILLTCGLLHLILALWSFVVLLKCVAEVHRFSAWAALGSLILAVLFFIALFAVIAVLVALVVVGVR
jgi:hypothetical protein